MEHYEWTCNKNCFSARRAVTLVTLVLWVTTRLPSLPGHWSSGRARAAVKWSRSTRPPEVPVTTLPPPTRLTCIPWWPVAPPPGGHGPVSWSKAHAVGPSAGCFTPSLRNQIHCNYNIYHNNYSDINNYIKGAPVALNPEVKLHWIVTSCICCLHGPGLKQTLFCFVKKEKKISLR